LDLPSILEKYNKQLLDSLKNDLIQSFRKNIIEDIKTEINNLFIYKKNTNNINICGFERTRKRGYCKRHVKGFACPYHQKSLKKISNSSILPDEMPDKKLSGTHNISTDIIEKIETYYEEINLLSSIEVMQTNKCNINKIYRCRIYNKKIDIVDKYLNNGYKEIKLIEYNINESILGSKEKEKKKRKKKKNNKTIEQLFNIFNDKIKNLISSGRFIKSETLDLKKIINNNLNKYNDKYKNNRILYIYDSSVMIFREIENYINKKIDHDIDYFNNMLRNIFFYYNIFRLLVDEDSTEEEKIKWRPRLEKFVMDSLKNF
jgi:hypothetical protein